jgi:hypothetical protein
MIVDPSAVTAAKSIAEERDQQNAKWGVQADVGRFNPSESSVDYFEQRARERAERQDGNYAGYKGG